MAQQAHTRRASADHAPSAPAEQLHSADTARPVPVLRLGNTDTARPTHTGRRGTSGAAHPIPTRRLTSADAAYPVPRRPGVTGAADPAPAGCPRDPGAAHRHSSPLRAERPGAVGVGTFCVSFSPNGAQLSGLGTEEVTVTAGKTGPATATQISQALAAQEVFSHRTLLKSGFPALGQMRMITHHFFH
jgi:hypothetical protein